MKPGESAMDVLLRAACERLVTADPPCCEPDSLASEAGIDPAVARSLLPSTEAVLQNIAESALRRQLDHLTRRLSGLSDQTPAHQLVELGRAYIEWAIENRNDFQVLNSRMIRGTMDKEEVNRYHNALQHLTLSMLTRARDQGQLRPDMDPMLLSLVSRAFSYGLARLYVDRQLALWEVGNPDEDEYTKATAALEGFADLLLTDWRRDQPTASKA